MSKPEGPMLPYKDIDDHLVQVSYIYMYSLEPRPSLHSRNKIEKKSECLLYFFFLLFSRAQGRPGFETIHVHTCIGVFKILERTVLCVV